MPTKDDLPDGVELNCHLLTLVGWYLAEGYVSSSKKRGIHRVTFCLGHSDEEMAFAKEIQTAAAALDVKASIRQLKIGIRVCIDCVKSSQIVLSVSAISHTTSVYRCGFDSCPGWLIPG